MPKSLFVTNIAEVIDAVVPTTIERIMAKRRAGRTGRVIEVTETVWALARAGYLRTAAERDLEKAAREYFAEFTARELMALDDFEGLLYSALEKLDAERAALAAEEEAMAG